MKTIYIIRHAKSDQSFLANDFDRPLNDRGRRDAPVMAKRLLSKKIKIDLFVSSPALRAKKTAELFCTEYDRKINKILFVPELYHAHPDTFYEVISKLDDEHRSIAVFSHNPGITDFVNSLTPTQVDNMPTAAVFSVTIDTERWKDTREAKKNFLFFDYPKLINP